MFDDYLLLYEREDIALKKIVKSALTIAGTDDYGFSALPGGYGGAWWTATEQDADHAFSGTYATTTITATSTTPVSPTDILFVVSRIRSVGILI